VIDAGHDVLDSEETRLKKLGHFPGSASPTSVRFTLREFSSTTASRAPAGPLAVMIARAALSSLKNRP
jgi:hypothetical protein